MVNATLTVSDSARIDNIDSATRLSAQLAALLSTISGEGFESFSGMAEGVQSDVLWLADDLAHQLREVAGQIASGR